MRLAIVTDAWKPQVNGVVRTYEHLIEALRGRGHDVRVVGPHDVPARLPMPGYREIELALFPYAPLAAILGDFRPEALHIGTEGPLGWAARRWCLRYDFPYTTAFHTLFPDYMAARAARLHPGLHDPVRAMGINYLRSFHGPAAGVLFTTPSIRRMLADWRFAMPLHDLPRGVPQGVFTPEGPRALDHLPRPLALYAGRVAVEKNLEDFLAMPWGGSKAVVGDGPSLAGLKARYPACHFTGKKTGADLAAHIRSADVFVFPSRTDTFGIVIIEALACGIPVAAYPVQGPLDIITDQRLGVLDPDLASAARRALTAPGTPQERHDHVMKTYSWASIADMFMAKILPHKITKN